jgi:D-alanyl-D-alanine carboxypeptidase/D-alanyl-D-alanine-endopeptidase (penicillin-binding protein 4)
MTRVIRMARHSIFWLPGFCLGALLALASAGSAADLEQRLDAVVRGNPAAASTGIQVVEVATGKVLYARNGDRLFLPASNLKILTSAMAWERLGPDYRFTTRVVREASGNVVLVGSGDPSLSGRAFPYQKDGRTGPPLQAIEDLAEQIAARGIRRIDGDIVGDDGIFPWDPYPPSWTQDDTIRDFGAPVSALSLNDNVVAVSASPGARPGDPAALSLSPPLEYLTLDNRILTLPRGESSVRAQRVPSSRQWLLTGAVAFGHPPVAEILPVDDPALFAAAALYDALIRRGILVRGQAVARHRAPGIEYTPVAGEELASRVSPPLAELLQVMDKQSQNLHAELLLRAAGWAAHDGTRDGTHDGTTDAGLAELRAYLAETGAVPSDWRLDDGSGLSRNALVTPRLLTHILARMAQSKDRDSWASLLPAGGEDGTLSHRLCCLSQGRGVRAKTGSLNRASALSGYADSVTYGALAFSILVNDFSAPPAEVRQWIDKIAAQLLE